MTGIEQEARAYAQRNVGLNVGTIGDRLRAAYIAGASRPASPATREAVVDVLVMTRLSDFAGTDIRVIEGAADALLAAFTITEKGAK